MQCVEAAARSHPGCVRENNEDNFFMRGIYMRANERNTGGLYKGTYTEKTQLYAVCDGMGGMDQGERASLQTVSGMDTLMSCSLRSFPKKLKAYIDRVTNQLLTPIGGSISAGCTLTAVYLAGSRAIVANLGDSRVYFKRVAQPLAQITEDHSQAVWYQKQGILTPEEAETHFSRNTLRRYVGAPNQEGRTPDFLKPVKINSGDAFLLCSDGLSNMMTISEMDAELSTKKSCSDICRSLVSLAIKRGGDDNITALMIRVS